MAYFLRSTENPLGAWWLPYHSKDVKIDLKEDEPQEKLFLLCERICAKLCGKRFAEKFKPKVPLSFLNSDQNLVTLYVPEKTISSYDIVYITAPHATIPSEVRCRAVDAKGHVLGYVDLQSLQAMQRIARRTVAEKISQGLVQISKLRANKISN